MGGCLRPFSCLRITIFKTGGEGILFSPPREKEPAPFIVVFILVYQCWHYTVVLRHAMRIDGYKIDRRGKKDRWKRVRVLPFSHFLLFLFFHVLLFQGFFKALCGSSQSYRDRIVSGVKRGGQFTERDVRALRARYLRSFFANPPEADKDAKRGRAEY